LIVKPGWKKRWQLPAFFYLFELAFLSESEPY